MKKDEYTEYTNIFIFFHKYNEHTIISAAAAAINIPSAARITNLPKLC